MTAKEAYEKALLNKPKRDEKEANEQKKVIEHIYNLIDLASEQGLMFFITEPIKVKYADGLAKQLDVDKFKYDLHERMEDVNLVKIKISWE